MDKSYIICISKCMYRQHCGSMGRAPPRGMGYTMHRPLTSSREFSS